MPTFKSRRSGIDLRTVVGPLNSTVDISKLDDNEHVRTVTVDIERLTDAVIVAVEEFFDDDLSPGDHEGLSEEVYSAIDTVFSIAGINPAKEAAQIVCEEWQRVVHEYKIEPGTPNEVMISRILRRLSGDKTQ